MAIDLRSKKKSFSEKAALIAAAVTMAALVGFIIYSVVYHEYFDAVVLLCLVLGVAGYAAYALVSHPIVQLLNAVSVFLISFGMGLFGLNSYNVWADWWGNFTMYGSRGGIAPVVALLVVQIAAIGLGIISSFSRKEGAQ